MVNGLTINKMKYDQKWNKNKIFLIYTWKTRSFYYQTGAFISVRQKHKKINCTQVYNWTYYMETNINLWQRIKTHFIQTYKQVQTTTSKWCVYEQLNLSQRHRYVSEKVQQFKLIMCSWTWSSYDWLVFLYMSPVLNQY